jgi:tetratricopeptide (TPR) repeat protein
MRSGSALFLSLFIASHAFAATPRVVYERVVPAPHSLGKVEHVALIHAMGDTIGIEWLVEYLVEQTNRSGTLRMYDARLERHALVAESLRKSGSDAFLAVRAFTCTTTDRKGEGTAHDPDGKRIPRPEEWLDAKCTARVEVLTSSGSRVSFPIKGEVTSKRVLKLTDDARQDALMHATRFVAIEAAEKITPRRIRETIPLDEAAPAFVEGFAMIESGRFEEARAIWEKELKRQPRSAPLHSNLAALCEALGDRTAAEQHHVAASAIAPKEKRYAYEYKSFMRRTLPGPKR